MQRAPPDGVIETVGAADIGAAARQRGGGIGDHAPVAEREAPQRGLGRDAPAADAAAFGDVVARCYELRSSAGSGSSAGSASGSAASGAGSSASSSAAPSVSSTAGTSPATSSGVPPT